MSIYDKGAFIFVIVGFGLWMWEVNAQNFLRKTAVLCAAMLYTAAASGCLFFLLTGMPEFSSGGSLLPIYILLSLGIMAWMAVTRALRFRRMCPKPAPKPDWRSETYRP